MEASFVLADEKPESLPIRHFLHYAETGRLPNTRVHAHDGTGASAVMPIEEYSPGQRGDYATIYSLDRRSFIRILAGLEEEYGWRRDEKPVIFAGLDFRFIYDLMQFFDKEDKGVPGVTIFGPYHVFHTDKPAGHVPRLASDVFEVSQVTPKDVEGIAEIWGRVHGAIIQKDDFLHFLGARLPQAAIRDTATGRLASWSLEYPIGAGACQHTLPEYRNQGLAMAVNSLILDEHFAASPYPHYNTVAVDNDAAIRLNKKLGRRLANVKLFWAVWHPHTRAHSELTTPVH